MFGRKNDKKNDSTENMTDQEKKDYERKYKDQDEWDKLIEADALGFFDE